MSLKLSMRDAEALVTLALALEERANRLVRRDPAATRRLRMQDLHRAAMLIGDVGRELRANLQEPR